MTDDLVDGSNRASRLCELNGAGERIYDIAREAGSVRRGKGCSFVASEIIGHDDFMAVLLQDQVEARTLELGIEQEMRVGNDDRVVRRGMRASVLDVNELLSRFTRTLGKRRAGPA